MARQEGGLNLVNVKYRAMAELIKSFLDTAISSTFQRNIFHQALYEWHVEENRSIPNPGKPGYYSSEFFEAIRAVKSEGLLRLSDMTIGMWYKAPGGAKASLKSNTFPASFSENRQILAKIGG